MKSSNHRISIKAYPSNCAVYIFSVNQCRLFNVIVVDRVTKKLVTPLVLLDTSDENIYTSEIQDEYGNKDCFHTYHNLDATLDIGTIPMFREELVDNAQGPIYNSYVGSTLLGSRWYTGKGNVAKDGSYVYVTESSSSKFVACTYLDGQLWMTDSSEIISISTPKGPIGVQTVEYRDKREYSAYARSKGVPVSYNWDRNISKSITPGFVGYTGETPTLSSDILNTILTTYSLAMREHFVPDNIIDNVYEKLTIPSVNNVENLKDLRDIRKSLPPIINMLKRRNFKSLAQFYLWYKYQYKTSCLDLETYYKFFLNWLKELDDKSNIKRTAVVYRDNKTYPKYSVGTITRYQVLSDPYNIGVLRTLGLDINLSNTWDLLPFSFVVDWFINLGDILAKIDHTDVLAELKIHSVISSTKRTFVSQPLVAYGCDALCYGSYYYRSIGHAIPLGKLEVSLRNPGSHLLDGTALIVARK